MRFLLLPPSELDRYFDRLYNLSEEELEHNDALVAEFDTAHLIIHDCLSQVGCVTFEGEDGAWFSMNKYVPINRAATVVADNPSALCEGTLVAMIDASRRILERLRVGYLVRLDADPNYCCVVPSGDVIGFNTEEDYSLLHSLGFEFQ